MTPEDFARRRWVMDGAMATYLFSKGAAHPVETLNLTDSALVLSVHREYLDAGAQILRTNSFGGTLDAKAAGVRIAREAAQSRALVAGVIGSTGSDGTLEWFRECAVALQGVDVFVLETFTSLSELTRAVEGVRRVSDAALIAQASVEPDGSLRDGSPPEVYGPALDALAADVIGFNCSFGPESIAAAFDRVRAVTRKPMSACPNAGLDEPLSAERMAAYANVGALVVGTCCGSTPEHTRRLRAMVDAQILMGRR
jgi:methionine synthase I (cobalamin-dependent)